MIHGIGTDIVDIKRVEGLYRKHGDKLLQRILSETELEQATKQYSVVPRLAKYIAAKEACFKALGIGRDQGIGWKDMEVRYHETGQPHLLLSDRIAALLPNPYRIHLSLSDTDELASAYVIIEAG